MISIINNPDGTTTYDGVTFDKPKPNKVLVEHDVPRRQRLDLNTPAELAISKAVNEIEKMGAHPDLTAINNDLLDLRDKLSDYIENEFNCTHIYRKWETSRTDEGSTLSKICQICRMNLTDLTAYI